MKLLTPKADDSLLAQWWRALNLFFAQIVVVNGNIGIGTTNPKSPLSVTKLPVFANNAGAIAGGLNVGDLYRTGADPDPVCQVH